MRSLVITPTPTHPTNQGNRARVHQIASALRRRGQVEVLYSAVDGLDASSVAAMRAAWDALYVVPSGAFRPVRRHPGYWGVDEWVSPQLIEAVRFLAASNRYDVVVANYVWCSLLLRPFEGTGAVRVIDTHDRFGDRHALTRAAGMRPHWFYTSVEEEARGLDRADIVLAIQPEEGRYFAGITRAAVAVVEYAVPPVPLPGRGGGRVAVGYLGSGNPWNVESVTVFDRALAAALAKREAAGQPAPDADFLLLGGITTKVSDTRTFQAAGVVSDIADAYAALDVVLNPMVGGTGLKIKTVEALAHGRAVLSTRDGGMGLEALHADLQHDDLHSLIQRLLALLDAPSEIVPLARAMEAAYRAFYAEVDGRLDGFVAAWEAQAAAGAGPAAVRRAGRPRRAGG